MLQDCGNAVKEAQSGPKYNWSQFCEDHFDSIELKIKLSERHTTPTPLS